MGTCCTKSSANEQESTENPPVFDIVAKNPMSKENSVPDSNKGTPRPPATVTFESNTTKKPKKGTPRPTRKAQNKTGTPRPTLKTPSSSDEDPWTAV